MDDVVVISGGAYGPEAGMLMYAPLAAERRGATIHRHHWSEQRQDVLDPSIEAWVRGEMAPLLDAVPGHPLLIGKVLLIGGTADRWWDGEVARRLSEHVLLEVARADHGTLVSGPAIDSISVLEQVVTAIDDFLDIVG
jgi:hypothetical protein